MTSFLIELLQEGSTNRKSIPRFVDEKYQSFFLSADAIVSDTLVSRTEIASAHDSIERKRVRKKMVSQRYQTKLLARNGILKNRCSVFPLFQAGNFLRRWPQIKIMFFKISPSFQRFIWSPLSRETNKKCEEVNVLEERKQLAKEGERDGGLSCQKRGFKSF